MEQNFVDVWCGQLTLAPENRQALEAMLSDGERQKARSFQREMMRDRYIAVRGLLRQTLASYLHVEPASLQFVLGEHGKPSLADAALHFNLSHSADTLLIAVADFTDIGVDIETRNKFLPLVDQKRGVCKGGGAGHCCGAGSVRRRIGSRWGIAGHT